MSRTQLPWGFGGLREKERKDGDKVESEKGGKGGSRRDKEGRRTRGGEAWQLEVKAA